MSGKQTRATKTFYALKQVESGLWYKDTSLNYLLKYGDKWVESLADATLYDNPSGLGLIREGTKIVSVIVTFE